MRKNLNLSIVACAILTVLSINVAYSNEKADAKLQNSNLYAQIFVNDQNRSLDQIAALSGITIDELRALNQGHYDSTDIVMAGDSIVLPVDSLLIVSNKIEENNKSHIELPELGSKEEVETNDDVVETYIAEALQLLATQDWENLSSDKVKEELTNKAQSYASTLVKNEINQKITDPLRQAAQNLLGYFGTAQLQYNISDQAKINNVNFKLFSPWYDSKDSLFFTQISYSMYDEGRHIGNFGLGQRFDFADNNWLLGYNVFFDRDFTNDHNRLGVGVEAWSDYLKFGANYYNPLSDWKDEKVSNPMREERAARGFDVKFQHYLPTFPQFSLSLMYEQYFGEQVALFGKDKLLKDPYAFTVGADYTPVPLFTVKAERKQGSNSNGETKVEVGLNYRIGVPLKDQLDPNLVNAARTLRGSRYDLVDRNNYIVLEYRDKKFSVDLSSIGEVTEGKEKELVLTVTNSKVNEYETRWNNVTFPFLRAEARNLNEELKALYENGGCILNNVPSCNDTQNVGKFSSNGWKIIAPDYVSNSGVIRKDYNFFVTLKAANGAEATSNESKMTVAVDASRRINKVMVVSDKGKLDTSKAPNDGKAIVTLKANLFDTTKQTAFNDNDVYSKYLAGAENINIESLNNFWAASENKDPVTFVKSENDCGTSIKCLIVKEVGKTVVNGKQEYTLSFATKSPLNKVEVTSKIAPYGEGKADVYFTTSPLAQITRFEATSLTSSNGEKTIAIGNLTNGKGTLTLTDGGDLKIGDKILMRAYAEGSDQPVEGVDFAWALVGNNSLAGCETTTTLHDDTTKPNGPWYHVHIGSDYTFKGKLTSRAGQGLSGLAVPNVPWGGTYELSAPTCAGDQGFKVKITAFAK